MQYTPRLVPANAELHYAPHSRMLLVPGQTQFNPAKTPFGIRYIAYACVWSCSILGRGRAGRLLLAPRILPGGLPVPDLGDGLQRFCMPAFLTSASTEEILIVNRI